MDFKFDFPNMGEYFPSELRTTMLPLPTDLDILPSPFIGSPPDGPFELDGSFPAPDLSSLITPSLLDEFELNAKRSLPSSTFSDSFHGIQTYSQSASIPVTNQNAPKFNSFFPPQKHAEPSVFHPMHANSGGLDQVHSTEFVHTAGGVIIPSNLLKGGVVHQSVVGQVPFKTEPLIAPTVANSNAPSLQQLLTSTNELQYLSSIKEKKHSRNITDPIVSADRAIHFSTLPSPSFSNPNIAQSAAFSPPDGLIPLANSSFIHLPHSSAPSFESDLAAIPLFQADASGSTSAEYTARFTFPGVCESDLMADSISVVAATGDANAYTEDESAIVTRCSSDTSADGSGSSSSLGLGGGARSPPMPMPTPPRSSSGSLTGSASDGDSEGSPPRQLSPRFFACGAAKDSPTTPNSVPSTSDDCALPLLFDDPVLSVATATSSSVATAPPASTVLQFVQQPIDTAAHATSAAAAGPTRYLLLPQTGVPRIVAFCNAAGTAAPAPAGGLSPAATLTKAKLIVAPATATGATSVTGSVVAPVPQTLKKATAKGKAKGATPSKLARTSVGESSSGISSASASSGSCEVDRYLSAEEREVWLGLGQQLPVRVPFSKAEERILKRVRRKIKNKRSAQESRRKRKEYMDELEKINAQLKQRVATVEAEKRSLQEQVNKLKAAVARISSQARSTLAPLSGNAAGTIVMVMILFFATFLGTIGPLNTWNTIGYQQVASRSNITGSLPGALHASLTPLIDYEQYTYQQPTRMLLGGHVSVRMPWRDSSPWTRHLYHVFLQRLKRSTFQRSPLASARSASGVQTEPSQASGVQTEPSQAEAGPGAGAGANAGQVAAQKEAPVVAAPSVGAPNPRVVAPEPEADLRKPALQNEGQSGAAQGAGAGADPNVVATESEKASSGAAAATNRNGSGQMRSRILLDSGDEENSEPREPFCPSSFLLDADCGDRGITAAGPLAAAGRIIERLVTVLLRFPHLVAAPVLAHQDL